jgi:hypothetical protein
MSGGMDQVLVHPHSKNKELSSNSKSIKKKKKGRTKSNLTRELISVEAEE